MHPYKCFILLLECIKNYCDFFISFLKIAQSNNRITMLEIESTCENCNIKLPYDSAEAMICKYCVSLLKEICSICGSGFEKRPIRPSHLQELESN